MVRVATLNDTAVGVGEAVKVVLQVENTGRSAGTFDTRLMVNGEAVDSRSVTIGAGRTEVIVFERTFEEPGRYRIGTDRTPLGEVFVSGMAETATPPEDERAGAIQIIEADLPADWVGEGFRTDVKVTVVNRENRTASRTLTVTIDGEPVATETVTLGPDERRTVTIGFEATTGTVAVDGVEAGRIEIRNTGRSPPADTDGPGRGDREFVLFALLVTALGITIAGVVTVARRYD